MIHQNIAALKDKNDAAKWLARLGNAELPAMQEIWQLCEDCFKGEAAIKAKAEKYIYRPESKRGNTTKAERAWQAYVSRGKFPHIPAKELKKSVGILSAGTPAITLENKAESLLFLTDYATPMKDGINALFRRTVEQVLRYGRYCLLLEPDNDAERGFHINEYGASKFLRAVPCERNGESFAELIILDTSSIVWDKNTWADVFVPQITLLGLSGEAESDNRVYYQAVFTAGGTEIAGYTKNGLPQWRNTDAYGIALLDLVERLKGFDFRNPDPSLCNDFKIPDKFGRTIDRIPFTVCNASSLNFAKYELPPLFYQCLLCLHALNADCAHQQALFITTDPIPVVKGIRDKNTDVNLSPDRTLNLGEGVDFGFVCAPTAGLAMQAQNIQAILAQAKDSGVFLAGSEALTNISGYALEIQRNSQTADLRIINDNCGNAIEEQLRWAGKWIGMSSEECATDIAFAPSRSFAEVQPGLADAEHLARVAKEFSITPQEKRRWAEENLGFPERDWEELQDELEAEEFAAESANVSTAQFPPVMAQEEEEEDPNAAEG